MKPAILIVDDSLTVRMDLSEALAAADVRTMTCGSLGEARAALARETFSLVILDVILPDGDGIALLAELRAAEGGGPPVMLLSMEAEVRDRARGIVTGATDYVGKPYDLGYVVSRARELVRQNQSKSSIPSAARRATVCVIDDSVTFREELRSALVQAGYEVLTAASGEEGLRLAADARPDAIIIDAMLPGIDGPTVVRRLRLDAALRRTPCLLLTASEDRGAELSALDAGADAFVRKDQELEVVLARLAAVLRSASLPQAGPETASMLGAKKLLAVDDSPTYLHQLADMLRSDGYDVVLAHSGEEALELLSIESVDCILLDLLMPGLGGEETCRRIKSSPAIRDVPLVMLTARDDRDAMIHGLEAGADDFIAKSSDSSVLKARVVAQLRRKQFEDENRRIRERLLRTELDAAEARASRELAETRAVLLEDVERKNKELEAFSYSVSHDLRAPLRAIDGFSKLLLEDYGDGLDAKGQGYLRRVRAAAQRMGELIDDLLELSRVGRAEMRREHVDLSGLARGVAAELRRANPERDVRVVVADGLLADGDTRLLRAVLENLLGNAWKFTSKTNDATIEIGATIAQAEPTFFVRDNGAGFDMAYGSKLFAPFQRLHAESDFPGTGIGLATVQRIVERHGGRIWAEGAVGRGATIFFTLAPHNREVVVP